MSTPEPTIKITEPIIKEELNVSEGIESSVEFDWIENTENEF